MDNEVADKIAETSERDMRMAIMTMQALNSQKISLKKGCKIPTRSFEVVINEICESILLDQSVSTLRNIRKSFYELLTHNIQAETIIELMTARLLKTMSKKMLLNLLGHAVENDYRCRIGSKDIVHLEAFAATMMMLVSQS